MSSSDNKRNIMIAVGAGVAILAGAVIYSLWSKSAKDDDDDAHDDKQETTPGKDESPSELNVSDLLQKLQNDKLVPVVFDQAKKIEKDYFLRLLQFVGANTRQLLDSERKDAVKKRRAAYKAKKDEEYHKIVADLIALEDKKASEILKSVLEELKLPENDFAYRHMQLSQDPQTAEYVMAAQQGKLSQPDMNKSVSMSRQQTVKHLEKTAEVQLNQMKSMSSQMNKQPPETNKEQMEMMVEMMVTQCKAQDQIWTETGEEYESEEFEAALLHYCARDPTVARAMQDYMTKMRSALTTTEQ